MLFRLTLGLSVFNQKFKLGRQLRKLKKFLSVEKAKIASLPSIELSKKGTLIVKCDDIGDFLIWQQVIPVITQNAERPIIFVGNTIVKPLIETWFDFADQYVWVDKGLWKNSGYREELYQKIRQFNVKTAYTTLFTRNFGLDDLLILAGGANRRIAWDRRHHTVFTGLKEADSLTTETIISAVKIEMEYFRNIEFIEKIYQVQIPHLFVPLFPYFSKQNRLIIFPVANSASRCWRYSNFVEVIKRVSDHFEQILLMGGLNAVNTCNEIETHAGHPKIVNLCNKTSLIDLMTFIGESQVLLCPDTSALHFGMLSATNTVVLSNGTNWQRFVNYSPYISGKIKVIYPPHFKPVMDRIKIHFKRGEIQNINVEKVVEAILELKE